MLEVEMHIPCPKCGTMAGPVIVETPPTFQEVMQNARRMCDSLDDCATCPIRLPNSHCFFTLHVPGDWTVSEITWFEGKVMQWAAEHPRARTREYSEGKGGCGMKCPYRKVEVFDNYRVRNKVFDSDKRTKTTDFSECLKNECAAYKLNRRGVWECHYGKGG